MLCSLFTSSKNPSLVRQVQGATGKGKVQGACATGKGKMVRLVSSTLDIHLQSKQHHQLGLLQICCIWQPFDLRCKQLGKNKNLALAFVQFLYEAVRFVHFFLLFYKFLLETYSIMAISMLGLLHTTKSDSPTDLKMWVG